MQERHSHKEVPPTRFVNNRVEVFAGITAVALLTVTIVPLIRSADQSSSLIKCTSNLMEISQGMRTYAVDYDDHLPPALSWQTSLGASLALPRYQGCPQSQEPSWGFAMNERLTGHPLAAIPTTDSNRVLLYDSSKTEQNAHDSGTSFRAPHLKKESPTPCGIIAFADGHASSYTKDDGMAIAKRGSR